MDFLYGEQLFYGQFERDFYFFLQRRRREQEEELGCIRAEGKLKLTLNQIEGIIKNALFYLVTNDAILQEISELKSKGIVKAALASDVFNKVSDFLPLPKLYGISNRLYENEELANDKTEKQKLANDERQSLPESQLPLAEEESADVMVQSGQGTEEENNTLQFKGEPETLLQSDSPELQETSGNAVHIESPVKEEPPEFHWPWAAINKELKDVDEAARVTQLSNSIEKKLYGYLLNPPQQPAYTEPEVITGRELGRCYVNVGRAEIKKGKLDRAHMAFSDALTIGCEEGDKELQWKAYDGLGTIAILQKDFESSTKSFEAAIYLLDRELSTFEVTALRNHIIEKMERKVP